MRVDLSRLDFTGLMGPKDCISLTKAIQEGRSGDRDHGRWRS